MKTMFYTGKGDAGTSIVGSKVSQKDDPFFTLIGTVDQCNSFIGVARAESSSDEVRRWLEQLQQHLFIVQAELAAQFFSFPQKQEILQRHVTVIESIIAKIDQRTPPLTQFVLPGGTKVAAYCDVARTVARESERVAVALKRALEVSDVLLQYLNRLSSVLFAIARYVNVEENVKEVVPTYE